MSKLQNDVDNAVATKLAGLADAFSGVANGARTLGGKALLSAGNATSRLGDYLRTLSGEIAPAVAEAIPATKSTAESIRDALSGILSRGGEALSYFPGQVVGKPWVPESQGDIARLREYIARVIGAGTGGAVGGIGGGLAGAAALAGGALPVLPFAAGAGVIGAGIGAPIGARLSGLSHEWARTMPVGNLANSLK